MNCKRKAMKYDKLDSQELFHFIRGYSRVEEIAKLFCKKYGSIYTYHELKVFPHESRFSFRVGQSTSGIRMYRPVDYVSIPFMTLMLDGEDLEKALDFNIEKFKEALRKEDERLAALRCDKCGRGSYTDYYYT